MGWFSNLFGGGKTPSAVKPPAEILAVKKFYINNDWLSINTPQELMALFKDAKFDVNVGLRKVYGRGYGLSGKNIKRSGDRQDEKALAMVLGPKVEGWSFQDFVFDDIPGGIKIKAQGIDFHSCNFTRIGEDAISTLISRTNEDDRINVWIDKCSFWNTGGNDKSVQLNNASACLLTSCYFTGGETAIRIQDSADKKRIEARISKCTFENVPTAINVSGKTALTVKDCIYRNVKIKVKKGPDSKVLS